jgi:hypothetical protein
MRLRSLGLGEFSEIVHEVGDNVLYHSLSETLRECNNTHPAKWRGNEPKVEFVTPSPFQDNLHQAALSGSAWVGTSVELRHAGHGRLLLSWRAR